MIREGSNIIISITAIIILLFGREVIAEGKLFSRRGRVRGECERQEHNATVTRVKVKKETVRRATQCVVFAKVRNLVLSKKNKLVLLK